MDFFNREKFDTIDDTAYRLIKVQIDNEKALTFNTPINVLLLTDRLAGCTLGVKEYLENSTNITADMVSDFVEATDLILKKSYDFLSIVGYLKDELGYEVF